MRVGFPSYSVHRPTKTKSNYVYQFKNTNESDNNFRTKYRSTNEHSLYKILIKCGACFSKEKKIWLQFI